MRWKGSTLALSAVLFALVRLESAGAETAREACDPKRDEARYGGPTEGTEDGYIKKCSIKCSESEIGVRGSAVTNSCSMEFKALHYVLGAEVTFKTDNANQNDKSKWQYYLKLTRMNEYLPLGLPREWLFPVRGFGVLENKEKEHETLRKYSRAQLENVLNEFISFKTDWERDAKKVETGWAALTYGLARLSDNRTCAVFTKSGPRYENIDGTQMWMLRGILCPKPNGGPSPVSATERNQRGTPRPVAAPAAAVTPEILKNFLCNDVEIVRDGKRSRLDFSNSSVCDAPPTAAVKPVR